MSTVGLIAHFTDIEVVGILSKKSLGRRLDPFAVVYIDERQEWESQKKFKSSSPHWKADLRLFFRPSSTITIEILHTGRSYFRDKTYLVGRFGGQVCDLLHNDTLLTLTDKNGSATGVKLKLKLKLFLVCDAMMDTTQTVDTCLNDDDGLAAASRVVCQSLQSLQQIVNIVDAIAEVYAICKVAWSMLSCAYNGLQLHKHQDDDIRDLVEALREALSLANRYLNLHEINDGSDVAETSRVVIAAASLIDEYLRLPYVGQAPPSANSANFADRIQNCRVRLSNLAVTFDQRLRVDIQADGQGFRSASKRQVAWKRLLSLTDGNENYNDLTGLVVNSNISFADGGTSTVFEGRCKISDKDDLVAIKICRVDPSDPASLDQTARRLKRELQVWSSLSHPNILPLLGISFNAASIPGLISPLYTNGDAVRYITEHPEANRWKIIIDVSEGLDYLHRKDIVHGDMKTNNVLIDGSGVARLADFGCSTIIGQSDSYSQLKFVFSARFVAPELVSSRMEDVSPVLTKESDTYSFALVALHILTEKPPFFYKHTDTSVLSAVRAGARPDRRRYGETTLSDQIWNLLEDCWTHDARTRPTMDAVIRRVSAIDSAFFDFEDIPASPVSLTHTPPATILISTNASELTLSPPTAEEQMPYRDLTGEVTKTEEHYFAYGGFSEVYKGVWNPPTHDVRRVAIKLLRKVHADRHVLEAMARCLHRETRVWHTLDHPNVLKFLGICRDMGPSPAMVSPLCDNGPVVRYLQENPQADRLGIIIGVARGLEYLHSRDVVHGDLKGHNILISDDGIPLLGDFGRSKFIDHRGFTTAFTGSLRYLAPELVNDGDDVDDTDVAYQELENQVDPMPNLTKETDVYAFSMVTLEIFTGEFPYPDLRQDSMVIALLQKGIRPDRQRYLPATFTDPMWALLSDCWKTAPEERPVMSSVIQRLESF